MNKDRSTKILKTTLAILINAVLLTPAYADNWNVSDGASETKDILDNSFWNGDAIVGNYAEAEITIGQSAGWTGNATIGEDSYIILEMGENSAWTGNVSTPSVIDPDYPAYLSVNMSEGSTWSGDVNGTTSVYIVGEKATIKGSVTIDNADYSLDMTESKLTGDLQLTGESDSYHSSALTFYDSSTWIGNSDSSYFDQNIELYSSNQWQGSANGTNNSFGISLNDNSVWAGNVNNYINDDNACCTYTNINLENGSQWFGNGSSEITGEISSYSNISLGTGALWQGNYSFKADSVNELSTLEVFAYYGSVWQGDALVSGTASVSIDINENAKWQGNLVFDDNYNLDPDMAYNTIMLAGSEWIGHIVGSDINLNMSMCDSSVWTITGDSEVKMMEFCDPGNVITFDSANVVGRDYHTLMIEDMEGDAHFNMRAGYYGPGDYEHDRIIIYGDKNVSGLEASDSTVTVVNNGSDRTHGTDVLTIIETVDGLDRFTLTNDVELGGYVYTMEQSGTNWILRPGSKGGSWQQAITDAADASANIVNVNYLINYADTQTLYQRMGDLRNNSADGNVWARAYYGKFNNFSSGLMRGFKMNYHGVQMGADRQFNGENGRFYLGGMAGLTDSNQDYRSGDGSAKNYHLGLYGTYITANGLYIDGLIKYNHFSNKFNVKDTAGYGVNGKSDSDGVTVSIEMGKRFRFDELMQGFYLEPQAQLSFSYQGSDNVKASNGLTVDIDSYNSTLGRIGTLIGYDLNRGDTLTNVYLKTSYVKEFDGNTEYALNGSKQDHSFKGDWWVNGLGVSVQLNNRHNFYVDMEYSNGNRFDQRQINGGYRLSF